VRGCEGVRVYSSTIRSRVINKRTSVPSLSFLRHICHVRTPDNPMFGCYASKHASRMPRVTRTGAASLGFLIT
jgi:hypothetical protein